MPNDAFIYNINDLNFFSAVYIKELTKLYLVLNK